MSWTLLLEQLLNGLQFGLMLFLMSTGVTLIFGVMGLVNIAHGAMFTLGAFLGFAAGDRYSYFAGVVAALLGTAVVALLIELLVMRRLYRLRELDGRFAIPGLPAGHHLGGTGCWGAGLRLGRAYAGRHADTRGR